MSFMAEFLLGNSGAHRVEPADQLLQQPRELHSLAQGLVTVARLQGGVDRASGLMQQGVGPATS